MKKLSVVIIGAAMLLLQGCLGPLSKNEAGISIRYSGLPGSLKDTHEEARKHCESYGKQSLLIHESNDGDFPIAAFECK